MSPEVPSISAENANKNFLRVWPRAGFGLNQELLRRMALLGDVLVLDCNAQCVHQMGESAIGRCTAFREGLRRGVHQYGNLVANDRHTNMMLQTALDATCSSPPMICTSMICFLQQPIFPICASGDPVLDAVFKGHKRVSIHCRAADHFLG